MILTAAASVVFSFVSSSLDWTRREFNPYMSVSSAFPFGFVNLQSALTSLIRFTNASTGSFGSCRIFRSLYRATLKLLCGFTYDSNLSQWVWRLSFSSSDSPHDFTMSQPSGGIPVIIFLYIYHMKCDISKLFMRLDGQTLELLLTSVKLSSF